MAMVVKNNMTAVNTLNILNKNSSALSKSLQKVSSGMKINSAADDASGYAISERMRVQIRSLDQANQNTQNGSSMMKVAEGAVSSTVEILKTLKEKAVNAANDSNTDSDRLTIQKELDQSIDQINDNANVTFNGKYLVDGSKNTLGNATYTALSNQSLSEDTKADTKLTELSARNGDSLEIHDTDKVTVSYVQAGKTYSTTFAVKGEDGKIATLQDIFTAAEDIDKDSKIFASADNKSVMAARVADGATQNSVDTDAAAAKQAETDLKAKEATLNNAITDLYATTSTAKGKVDAYNTASNSYAALVSGTTLTAVSSGEAKNDGEYLAALEGSKQYDLATKTVGSAAIGNIGTAFKNGGTVYAEIANGLSVVEGKIDAITDVSADEKAALKATAGEIFAANKKADGTYDTATIQAAFAKIGAAATALGTAAGDMKTAVDATGMKKPNAANDTKYLAYTNAKTAYDDAKTVYDAVAAPAVLTGKTVGIAASDDNVTTASGQKAITITANQDGIKGQISGFNISISDSQGNVKKSANAALDAFEETIRAQNKSADNAISLQVGAKANQAIKVGLTDMRAEALGLQGHDGTKLNISTQTKANAAINVLDNAIQKALDQQTTIGSVESRLEYTSSNLSTASENVQASESTIRDADMAKEMTEYTKNNVLLQAAQSMLAQANQSSSNVLSLLQ